MVVISMNNFAINLKKRRKELGLSQDDLAHMLGYRTRSSITKIEKGLNDVPIKKINDFARALQTTPAVLMEWTATNAQTTQPEYVQTTTTSDFDLEVLAEKLKNNGFEAIVFQNPNQAADYIVRTCIGKSVGIGHSVTIDQMDIFRRLKVENSEEVYSIDARKSRENAKKAMTSDVFILSANGIAYDTAEIVNISSDGVRIAGSLYYADEVIFVIGKNKIASNMDEAIYRAQNVAKPKSAKKYGFRTPCAEANKCSRCNSSSCACRVMCIYRRAFDLVVTTIILIDEDLGD
jgi:transcriptional regulator with XRE-family HTH domain